MLESLNKSLIKNFTRISATALKMCWHYKKHNNLLYMELHRIINRATPSKISKYKLALQLCKVFTDQIPSNEWINLNWEIVITLSQTKFIARRLHNSKIGLNIIALNGKIPLDWLKNLFGIKLKIKNKFLNIKWALLANLYSSNRTVSVK